MDEQTQAEFVQWLAQQLGVGSEEELQKQITDMGDEGIKQAFQVFQKEKQTPMNKQGGKLDYLKHLNTFKKGGKIADKGTDSKTAVGVTKFNDSKEDHKAGHRNDSGSDDKTAVKKVKKGTAEMATGLNRIKALKGKDSATALHRRKDSGKNEHTALNK